PVAASVVNTTFADSTYTVINASDGASTPAIKTDVKVSTNLSAIAAVVDKTNTTDTIPGSLTGTISATYNGTTYTGNLESATNNAKIEDSSKQVVQAKDLVAGKAYTVTIENVSFNFGTANANKDVVIGSDNTDAKFTVGELKVGDKVVQQKVSDPASTVTVHTDQNGVAKLASVVVSNVYAIDTTNNSVISFYDTTTGALVTTGAVSVNADNQGQLNVRTVASALKAKYFAARYEDQKLHVKTDTDFEGAVRSALTAANISVDAAGYFKAPQSLNVTLTAKSTVNGKVATLPVVVTVPNAAVPAEVTTTKNIMHVAKIYDKDGKATSEASLHAYDSVTVVKDPVTINGAKYFKLAGKDQYVKFGNIEGTSRTLSHNSYVYKNTGKATTVKSGKKTVKKLLKKGSSVTTFGSAFNINGHKMYRIGKNQYVKVANF
ncbi:SLAP domain-containing protein, partial [Lactobacillus pasteurii]